MPEGEERYVREKLFDKSAEIMEDAAKAVELLGSNK